MEEIAGLWMSRGLSSDRADGAFTGLRRCGGHRKEAPL
jgi:hypothetical protein